MQVVALEGENSLLRDLMKIRAGQFSSLSCKLKARHRIKEGRQKEKISTLEKEKELLEEEKDLLKKDKKEAIAFERKLGKQRLHRSKMASSRAFARSKVSIFPSSVYCSFFLLIILCCCPSYTTRQLSNLS